MTGRPRRLTEHKPVLASYHSLPRMTGQNIGSPALEFWDTENMTNKIRKVTFSPLPGNGYECNLAI